MKRIAQRVSFPAAIAIILLTASAIANYSRDKELIGPLTKERIFEAVPDWKQEAAAYRPDLEAIDKIRSISRPVLLRVFVATWCPDCKVHVSAFFRIMEMADNHFITTEYIGVSRNKKEPAGLIQENMVERVPTFIVFIDGVEMGRIVEHPSSKLEADLAEILINANKIVTDVDLLSYMDYFRTNPHSDLPINCKLCHVPDRR